MAKKEGLNSQKKRLLLKGYGKWLEKNLESEWQGAIWSPLQKK